METKLFLDKGIVDISHINISVQEKNSKVSDQLFSKYMFEFNLNMTPYLMKVLGDYVSYETKNLQNRIPFLLLFENRIHDAFLNVQSGEGYNLTLQIDFGFEELPNAEKKLSELPYEKFTVNDIHTYAKSVCEKTWPLTNFNFPRIYTTEFPATDELWKNFDGYINDLEKDGSKMRKNYIDTDGTIRNINIIHPCPHPIYILKTGFKDAGFELAGDILTDSALANRWVYSGTEYFSRLTQRRYGLQISENDYDAVISFTHYYFKNLVVEKKGNYRIRGFFNSRKIKGTNTGNIMLNGNIIWSFNSNSYDTIDYWFDININVATDNTTLLFNLHRVSESNASGIVISVELIGNELDATGGEDNGVITNPNEIDLSRAVPDMTFPEYINVFRNWFNYDLEIKNKTAIMNKIGDSEVTDVKDFRKFESAAPPFRNFLNKKSFLLKFLELDQGYSKDNMFYDTTGPKLNGKENSETTTIEIKGYAMPLILPKAGGYNTANVLKKSTDVVALVEYSGLQFGQNNAIYTPGCDFPELFSNNWEKWLRQRLNGQEFIWKKKVNMEEYSQYKIKDYIRAYNNIHIIKSLTKDKVSDNNYEIEFTTETVV